MSDRTAIILDVRHWRAAQQRRENLRRAAAQGVRHPTRRPGRLTLDDILGPAFDPPGGAA
ncbi:MAG: hypothetical protein ACLGIM_02205 [Alphaproteobacteria bacterium]